MTERKTVAAVSVLALTSFAMVIIATSRGPGLDPDAVHYMSSGINLGNGRGLTSYTGEPLTLWPPGLPFVAAVGEWTGLPANLAVRVFEGACFAAIVILAYVSLRRVTANAFMYLGLTALVAVSPSFLDISKKAWTDAPLVVCSLLLVYLLSGVLRRRVMTRSVLAGIAAICWAGFLFRYVGLFLIVVALVGVALALRPNGRATVVKWTVALAGVSVVVPALWVIRNQLVDGTALGSRGGGSTLADSAEGILRTFGQWVVPMQSARNAVLVPIGVAACIAVGVSAWLALRTIPLKAVWRSGLSLRNTTLAMHLLLLVVYLTVIIMSASRTNLVQLNYRLLAPILVPCVVLVGFGASVLVSQVKSKSVVYLGGLALCLLVVGHLAVSIRDVRIDRDNGILYASRQWTESDLAQATLDRHQQSTSGGFLTNEPQGLWSATGLEPITTVKQLIGQPPECVATFSGLVAIYESEGSEDDLTALSEFLQVVEIGSFVDGRLFVVSGDRTGSGSARCSN